MTVFYSPSENFHPYECDGPGKCRHCDRMTGPSHDPATCALCADDPAPAEDGGSDRKETERSAAKT